MHRDSANSWKAFSASCWLWKHYSLQEVVKMLEEVVVGWQKVRWTGRMKQNFIAQLVQLLKYWLYNVQSGVTVEKNWALFGWPTPESFQCISLICWAYSSDGMVLLGFRKLLWLRTAADHQTVTTTLFLVQVGFGKCFGTSFWSSHWAGHHWLLYKIHLSLHITIQLRNYLLLHRLRKDDTLKCRFFFFFLDLQLAHEAATYRAFSTFQFVSNAKWL